ncbi:54S ribosomal protein IMG2, mitochondrial [Basidiobolus ranarum]|uniref:Large ribosomal subunit protein mL49 n=1 Tax=Basidiobolus ranarum TaxID=34480 RepID=A0ABR2X4L6_9FUNG
MSKSLSLVLQASKPAFGGFSRAAYSTKNVGRFHQKSIQYPKQELPADIKYFVRRTAGKSLPVYSDIKNGGTRFLTLIRRAEGDLDKLRQDLIQVAPAESISINRRTSHIVFKGNYVREVRKWLTEKGF